MNQSEGNTPKEAGGEGQGPGGQMGEEERTSLQPSALRPRVRLLDFLRGFSVLSMVLYHGMFDVVWLFGHDISWYKGLPGYLWQQSICWVFILVSGAALHYGKHTLRRALTVLGCALVVSLVSFIAMPEQRVMSGILHMLGLSMLLYVPLRRPLQKVPPLLGLLLCSALFLLTKTLPWGYLGFADTALWALPEALYQTPFLFPLGFPGPGFFSGDYFPLLPWFFLFLAGYFGWALLKPKVSATPPGKNPLEWAGRHSLLIYMLHQPLLYGLCLLLAAAGVL